MATTPMPYRWKFNRLVASGVDNTGTDAHYFDEEAQSLYLKNGIATKMIDIESGRWEDSTLGTEEQVTDNAYTNIAFDHPANESLYGVAYGDSAFYLLRYMYARNIGKFIENGKQMLQVDNPISQIDVNVMNYDVEAFTKKQTLYLPGARIILGVSMGDSPIFKMGNYYIDDIDFKYNQKNVSISGRNSIGYLLNDQTFNESGTYNGTITSVVSTILERFGVTRYLIESDETVINIAYSASDTGLKVIQTICELMTNPSQNNKDWDIEEMADGTIIAGYNTFREGYLPKGQYQFNGTKHLFKRGSKKSIDGAYTKVYCTGKDASKKELIPEIRDVQTYSYWRLGATKTYFAPTLEGVTQAYLAKYADVVAGQLRLAGVMETYSGPIRPQLLVGDTAVVIIGSTSQAIGAITEVTHSFGKSGFFTDFTADSGGEATQENPVKIKSRAKRGTNRKKRVSDFFAAVPKKVSDLHNDSAYVADANYVHTDNNYTNDASQKVADAITEASSYIFSALQNGIVPKPTQADIDAGKVLQANGTWGTNGSDTLADLNDVDISSPSNGQVLKYDSSDSKWKNADDESYPFSVVNGKVCITYDNA